jgi:hypothetical protein
VVCRQKHCYSWYPSLPAQAGLLAGQQGVRAAERVIARLVAQGYLGALELPVVVSELVQARAVGLAMPVAAVDNMELAAQAESGVGLPAVID